MNTKHNSRFNPPYAAEQQPQFRTGVVTAFYPATFTADVRMEGVESKSEVPILGMYGSSMGSDLVWLQNLRGSIVLMVLIDGEYHILTTVPQQVPYAPEEPPAVAQPVTFPSPESKVTAAANTTTHTSRSFNRNRPTDLLPGDKLIRAEDGAELGLFRGGITRLKASPMAQFILGKYRDLAMLIARRFKIHTDFGEVEFFHREGGKVGLEMKGGADYATETQPNKQNWSVLVTAGSNADDSKSRLFIEVRDSGGSSKVTLNMKNDGDLDVWAKKDMNLKADGKINLNC
jgi:hypothetical protein